jgi:DNA polymerase-4/DNA polymerase V
LEKYGIKTAYDFASRAEGWVEAHLSKPHFETWQELRGKVVFELNLKENHIYKSISKTKTFTPPSRDRAYIFSQLSKNIENACIKARRHHLVTPLIYFFLKTQDFRYSGLEIKLSRAVSVPEEIIKVVKEPFAKLYRENVWYRATGVVLGKLKENTRAQLDLFGGSLSVEKTKVIYESLDSLAGKFGKHTVFLASSLQAMVNPSHKGARGLKAERTVPGLFKGETARKRLGIPMLGEAH